MITQGIIEFVLGIFSPVVGILPSVEMSGFMASSGVKTFLEWVSLAAYVIPFDTFLTIFGIIVGLHIFRIVISFFKSLWGVLPVV